MADKKISQLTGASTPLAGTEVLPVVQSGSTVKVAVSDLTAGRAVTVGSLVSNGNVTINNENDVIFTADATVEEKSIVQWLIEDSSEMCSIRAGRVNEFGEGYLDIYTRGSGPSQKAVRVNQFGTVRLERDNLYAAVAGKGVDFGANTGAAGKTSSLLNWYEEGTWTATVKGGSADPSTPLTGVGYYTRIGRQVTVIFELAAGDTTGATGQIIVAGLPFANTGYRSTGVMWNDRASSTSVYGQINASATQIIAVDGKGAAVTWASSGTTYMNLCVTYFV